MNPINTVLLSYGMSGKVFHAPFINSNPKFNLKGAWERNNKSIGIYYPESISYNTFEDVLKDKTVELVIVNTPNYTHFEYAKKCLLANKHIVVEKAFTTNEQEAIELTNLAKKMGKCLAVYHNRRYDSDFLTIQHYLKQGIIDKIFRMEFRFEKYKPQLNIKKHKEEINAGSGILKDLGPHLIDQVLVLVGMPDAVFARLDKRRTDSLVDDDDFIILKYPNFDVHIYLSLINSEALPAYKIIGSNGVLTKERSDNQEFNLINRFNFDNPKWRKDKNSAIFIFQKDGQEQLLKLKNLIGNYGDFYNELFNSLLQQKDPAINGNDGIKVMKIIDACILSNQTKLIVNC